MDKSKLPIFIIAGKSPIEAFGGGYSAYAHNLAKILTDLGHKVYICALGENDKIESTKIGTLLLTRARVPLLNVNIYALPGLPLYSFYFAKKIREIINLEDYKKVVVWGIGPWGFGGTALKKLLSKKVTLVNNYFTTTKHEWSRGLTAVRIQDYGILLKLKYLLVYLTVVQYLAFLERILLKSADIIITNYASTEKILSAEFGINPSRFRRLNFFASTFKRGGNKVSTEKETKLPEKYLFFFSRHDPRKGINFLLHAQKMLIQMGYKMPLYIAGGGDMLAANIALTKKLNLEKHVKFLGFVKDPKPLMKNCYAFIFPSIEEGAGALTINEAMEVGIPIVTTACDGIVEDIENGKEGILVPMGDSKALASAVALLIDNPKLAKRLGVQAKKRYQRDFSYASMKKDIQNFTASLGSK